MSRIIAWGIRNYRLGYAFVLCCWAGWLLQTLGGTFPYDYFDLVITMDHLAFYTAAKIALDPSIHAGKMYDLGFVSEYQANLFPGRWLGLEAFRNPPFYALLYTSTSWLPYQWSALIWSALSLAALGLGVRWLAPERPWRILGHAVGFYPVLAVMQFGQNSLLSFALFCGIYRLLANERRFAAGLAAGLLAFKPTLLLGLIFWAILDIRRKWPCILGATTTGVILTAGSYLIIPDAWVEFLNTLPANVKFDDFEWWKNHTPRAFVRLLIPCTARTPWEGRATLAASLIGAAWFLLIWRKHRGDLRAMFGAMVLLTLWASPHALIYEWAIAFAAGYLWWERAPDRRNWGKPLAILWFALLVSTDFCRLQNWVWRQLPDFGIVILVQVSLPAVVWFGWASWKLLRREVPGVGAELPPQVDTTRVHG